MRIIKLTPLIRDFFSKGHERTLKAKKNIALSFFVKGGSILTLLIMVPLTINYVNPTQYGIWITLSSIISWFNFFDMGFGHGLKNKLSESIAKDEAKLGRIYVSTAYTFIALIAIILFAAFAVVNHFLDWSRILNVSSSLVQELNIVALMLFLFFCFQFVLQLINVVSVANQDTMITTVIAFFGNLMSLFLIFILTKTTKASLLYLCFSISLGPIASLIIFSIGLYSTRYRKFLPSIKLADFAYAKSLMSLGLKFFLIQIGFIFFYNTNNVIISRTIGSEAVTPYSIAFQYFSVITMLSNIFLTPFWVAFSEANIKKDYSWIRRTVRRLEFLCGGLFLLSLCMLVVSPIVYKIWMGDKVKVPFSLSAVFSFYVALNTLRTVYCYYLNGVGKILLQVYTLIISATINIPLAIFLGSRMGSTGVILSTSIIAFCCGVIEFLQYKKLISNSAIGIWNK